MSIQKKVLNTYSIVSLFTDKKFVEYLKSTNLIPKENQMHTLSDFLQLSPKQLKTIFSEYKSLFMINKFNKRFENDNN